MPWAMIISYIAHINHKSITPSKIPERSWLISSVTIKDAIVDNYAQVLPDKANIWWGSEHPDLNR